MRPGRKNLQSRIQNGDRPDAYQLHRVFYGTPFRGVTNVCLGFVIYVNDKQLRGFWPSITLIKPRFRKRRRQ